MAASKSKSRSEIIKSDCVTYIESQPAGFAHLVVADPPYNQGENYDNYEDARSVEDYWTWTVQWFEAVVDRALNKHGSLWVFVPDEWVSEVDILARGTFHLYKRRHVIWAFTFGQANQKNFSRSHCHLLYFTKTKTKFTFNPDAVRVPSARQLVYNDKRANGSGKLPDDTWMLLREQLEESMTGDKDVWLESRICGTFKERKKHSPNQIPVPIMERIVLTCSNPGDVVFDPFCGTGSSGAACAIHNRNYVATDVSALCVRSAKRRITDALDSLG